MSTLCIHLSLTHIDMANKYSCCNADKGRVEKRGRTTNLNAGVRYLNTKEKFLLMANAVIQQDSVKSHLLSLILCLKEFCQTEGLGSI